MNIDKILSSAQAIHKGHTVFKNGLHSDGWLEKNAVLKDPILLDSIAKIQAKKIKETYPDVSFLAGPIVGGAILVSFIAKHLKIPFGIILGKDDPVTFHGVNSPKGNDKVVLVEDIISSGVDIKRFINFIKSSNLNLLGVSVWASRQKSPVLEKSITTLLDIPFETYSSESCPLCKRFEPKIYNNIRE